MRILLGCERTQACTLAFLEQGHDARSCDLQTPTGGRPDLHYQQDIFEVIASQDWDAAVFFPPCTDLAVSGAKHFEKKRADGRQRESIAFFLRLWIAAQKIPKVGSRTQ